MSSSKKANKIAKSKTVPSPDRLPKKKSSTYSALSTEYVQESDDDNDGDDKQVETEDDSLPENPANAMPKINGKSLAPDKSDISSENEGGEESEEDTGSDDEEVSRQQTPKPVKDAKSVEPYF